jgi:hypothetical protein
VPFKEPEVVFIPMRAIVTALLEARAGEEPSLPDRLRGIAAGVLLQIVETGKELSIPEGVQLATLAKEGGWIAITIDGIWHFTKHDDPVPIAKFYAVAK